MGDSPLIHAPPPQFYGKKGIQRLKAFAFGVIKVNDEHMRPRLKRKIMS